MTTLPQGCSVTDSPCAFLLLSPDEGAVGAAALARRHFCSFSAEPVSAHSKKNDQIMNHFIAVVLE